MITTLKKKNQETFAQLREQPPFFRDKRRKSACKGGFHVIFFKKHVKKSGG